MVDSFGNKDFVTRLCDDLFSADGELEPPIHHGHQLVRRVDEIIPLSSGWVGEHITGVAPPVPVLSHLVMINRNREFLTGEIGH